MSTLINGTSLGNLLIVTGSFILLLLLVKKFAWSQLAAIFKTREEKIAKDIDDAENSRQNAQLPKLLITLRKLVKLKSLRL